MLRPPSSKNPASGRTPASGFPWPRSHVVARTLRLPSSRGAVVETPLRLSPHPTPCPAAHGGMGPHPALRRSCHRAPPCPQGPVTLPAVGRGSVRPSWATKLLPHVAAMGPHLTISSPALQPQAPTRCPAPCPCAQLPPAEPLQQPPALVPVHTGSPRKPARWAGRGTSSTAPGARRAAAPRHNVSRGLLLRDGLAPAAPEGFNSSSSGFHNPAKPPRAVRMGTSRGLPDKAGMGQQKSPAQDQPC